MAVRYRCSSSVSGSACEGTSRAADGAATGIATHRKTQQIGPRTGLLFMADLLSSETAR